MTLPDDLFEPLTPPNPAAVAKKCAHPRAYRLRHTDGSQSCARCEAVIDPEKARRGRLARARGLRVQREQLRKAGMESIPYNKPNHDGRSEMFAAEVKSGGAFPERLYRWLRGVPATASQTRILIVSDAPGPGHRRRAVVVMDLDDFVELHGPLP